MARQHDIRDTAIYSIADAARFTGLPVATLRAWTVGRPYQAGGAKRWSNCVLTAPPSAGHERLSFNNITEAHILCALRRHHRIKMSTVRDAVLYIKREYQTEHPLLHPRLMTDGAHLFIDEIERLVCASQEGQLALRDIIRTYLARFDLDAQDLPRQFYPFTRDPSEACPRIIAMSPAIMCGSPVIAGTRITTSCVYDRFMSGESAAQIAKDYGRPLNAVEEAIRLENRHAA